MTFDVLLVKQPNDGYIARPVFWPDAVAHGATEQEALNGVRVLIHSLLAQTQLVQDEIAGSQEQTDNPWLDKAGVFANDPTWDSFQKVMSNYRQQVDNQQAVELA